MVLIVLVGAGLCSSFHDYNDGAAVSLFAINSMNLKRWNNLLSVCHEFHETSHSITFYFIKKLIF